MISSLDNTIVFIYNKNMLGSPMPGIHSEKKNMPKESERKKEPVPPADRATGRWLGGCMAAFFVAMAVWIFVTGEYSGRTKQGTLVHVQGTAAYATGVFFLALAMLPAALTVTSLRYAKAILIVGGAFFIAAVMFMIF